ncbi:MAG: hypothetical protein AB7P40_26935 [Chloroflexota bacterium]
MYVTAPPASPHDASRREIARSAVAGLGGSALTRALERWRRVLVQDRPPGGSAAGASAAGASGGHAADPDALAMLARRLDDSGCSYGRVSAARLEQVIRAYDRLETKINAVLMAVTGTFLSTLAGLLLYYARGGGQ